jgi:hypothetical protein
LPLNSALSILSLSRYAYKSLRLTKTSYKATLGIDTLVANADIGKLIRELPLEYRLDQIVTDP